MLMRLLLISFLLLVTFQGSAEENSLPATSVEKQATNEINQASPSSVEVGRHVMGNIDAGSMIISLLLVLVAIVVAAGILKKLQVGGTTVNGLKVVTSLNLGAKERLVVVQVGEKQLLLGVTGQQINVLDTLDEPIEMKSAVPIEFSQTIARFSRNSANKDKSEKYS
jgi:flagellar protein FliO/FliZ